MPNIHYGSAIPQTLPRTTFRLRHNCSHIPPHFSTNPNHRLDILDMALVRLPYPTQIYHLNELSSDHNPIPLETMCIPIASTPPVTNRFNTLLTNLPNTIRRTTDSQ